MGRGGDQHLVVELAGRRLDPGGDVDGVADDAEVEPAGAADRPGDHGAGVDADPDAEQIAVTVVDALGDPNRGANSTVRVVVEPLRRPEDGQQAVADELVDVSAVVGDDRHHGLKEPVDRSHDLLCVGPRGEAREVAHIAEQQRHVGLEAVGRVLVAEDVLGDLLVEVGAEGLADPLALGEPGDHLVEGSG